MALVRLLADPRRSFLDVGANIGLYSHYASRYFRHVYALEPHPSLGANLKAILGRSGTVMPIAASDRTGMAEFSIPLQHGRDVHARSSLEADANPGFGTRTVTVSVDLIDNLGLADLGMVKIDVEGHEIGVLRGARETLSLQRPAVVIETEERHHAGGVNDVCRFFDELDYRGYFIHRAVVRSVEQYDVDRFQDVRNAKTSDGKRSLDYVNNLIFLPAENRDQLRRLEPHFRLELTG